jgi:hypothetical protein
MPKRRCAHGVLPLSRFHPRCPGAEAQPSYAWRSTPHELASNAAFQGIAGRGIGFALSSAPTRMGFQTFPHLETKSLGRPGLCVHLERPPAFPPRAAVLRPVLAQPRFSKMQKSVYDAERNNLSCTIIDNLLPYYNVPTIIVQFTTHNNGFLDYIKYLHDYI